MLQALSARFLRAASIVLLTCLSLLTSQVMLSVGAVLLAASAASAQLIMHVDIQDGDPTPPNLGDGWDSDAYKYLSDALEDARNLIQGQNPPTNGVEIRIRGSSSGGLVYVTDESAASPSGTNLRTATFELENNISLRGGYNGGTGADADDQEPDIYVTILSGEINQAGISDNSYHVVRGDNLDNTVLIEGVTITGGNADVPSTATEGGGLLLTYSTTVGSGPTINWCTFEDNTAYLRGGGLFVSSSAPMLTIRNSDFIGNLSMRGDGGAADVGAGAEIVQCRFAENIAINHGGGVYCDEVEELILVNCLFAGNSTVAGNGGGVYAIPEILHVNNCVFSHNEAFNRGGGMYVEWVGLGEPEEEILISNSSFSGNDADFAGGLLLDIGTNEEVYIDNSILYGNFEPTPGAAPSPLKHPPLLPRRTCSSGTPASRDGQRRVVSMSMATPVITRCSASSPGRMA